MLTVSLFTCCLSCVSMCVVLQTISGGLEGSMGYRWRGRTSVPWALSTRRAWPNTSPRKAQTPPGHSPPPHPALERSPLPLCPAVSLLPLHPLASSYAAFKQRTPLSICFPIPPCSLIRHHRSSDVKKYCHITALYSHYCTPTNKTLVHRFLGRNMSDCHTVE